MNTRNPILSAVAGFVILLQCASFVFALPVYTYGGDFNLHIPAEPDNTRGWMPDAIINIPDSFPVLDLDVRISLTHTSAFDLQVFLQHTVEMDGKSVKTRICLNMYDFKKGFFKGRDYINTIFDDQAHIPIERARTPFTGRFRPRSPFRLSTFNDHNAFGQWSLQIYDAYYYDTGSLNSFELIITTPEPATAVLLMLGATLMSLYRPRRCP